MAEALARITRDHGQAMIQIRADLDAARGEIARALGMDLPAPLSSATAPGRRLCWMSPDELLLMLPRPELGPTLDALNVALGGMHALVLDVSDMRAVFAVEGARADQVLMKLCPADIASIPEDGVRRSRLAQVACAIWRQGGGYGVIGFRSVADYIQDLLENAARPGTGLDPR